MHAGKSNQSRTGQDYADLRRLDPKVESGQTDREVCLGQP
jgi:hypothetical protein